MMFDRLRWEFSWKLYYLASWILKISGHRAEYEASVIMMYLTNGECLDENHPEHSKWVDDWIEIQAKLKEIRKNKL